MMQRNGARLLIPLTLVVLTIVGCAQSTVRSPAAGAPVHRTCVVIYNAETLDVCKNLAIGGDPEAAMRVGNAYAGPFNLSVRPDPREAVYWYSRAADLGSPAALRKLFDAYYFGHDVPKNEQKAEELLQKGAEAGAHWAQLLIAFRMEKSEPIKAAGLYLTLARADNCHAQARLAQAYYAGDLVPRNAMQAYFWLLLAKVGGFTRRSESHPAYNPMDRIGSSDSCLLRLPFEFTLERLLSPDYLRLAQEAASDWRPGEREPLLPEPSVITGSTVPGLPGSKVPRSSEPSRLPVPPTVAVAPGLTTPSWAPLPQSAWRPRLGTSLDPVRLFEVASQSVWLVFAARSTEELRRAGDVALGSAVAVTSQFLLTNCHVIEARPLVWIKQGEKMERVGVAFGDSQSDRCILSVAASTLTPIQGMRRYEDLKIGEEVYTIGAPSGLEATLGQGVISGLRKLERQHLLQTSAPISPGSSGGGLFDKSGNLIGVTSFRLREGQSLNFAIAVDDYFR